MTRAAGRKLRVFQAQFGFYDSVVAAPSRAAALRAWGTGQNLFANGEAKVTSDEAAVTAATAHPETPLRRAVGSNGPFAVEPTRLPKVAGAPEKAIVKRGVKAGASLADPPADRSQLEAAEKSLKELEERRKREEADFRRKREDLEKRRAAALGAYVEARKDLSTKVAEAKAAYRKAGGGR